MSVKGLRIHLGINSFSLYIIYPTSFNEILKCMKKIMLYINILTYSNFN